MDELNNFIYGYSSYNRELTLEDYIKCNQIHHDGTEK